MSNHLHLDRRGTLGLAALGLSAMAYGAAPAGAAVPTRARQRSDSALTVTLLGTGSPVPSIERMGNSTLVQAGGYNLVFDGGRGLPIRLVQAGLHCGQIDGIFLTHYHSDHVNGVADAWMMGYVPALGARTKALDLYGPTGVHRLAAGLRLAHADDIRVRVADKEVNPAAAALESHESQVNDAVVFNRDGVVVRMFEVDHDKADAITPAVGYRVDYRGHSVLISGDTRPCENVIKWGRSVDLLIHEVADFLDPTDPVIQGVYEHHTSPQQAGKIFDATRPQMAAYSHIVAGIPPRFPEVPIATLVDRTRENYGGALTVGEDLLTFTIDNSGIDVVRATG
ncbi:ribonuclease Z [Nocardioides sp. YR527]|uniref:MBL fold metallo-hydrolase n=1 Tax=Nocardioides sp. YR527 TaxID=1881028 RepID=UPI000882D44A|nr:MBL fold metallo-hydrolase [Nocardioides sp. YR527]SDK22885.1 ribonuclease Z [Nocardioides sp. YR527]